MLKKTVESPLDCKGIQPVHPKWDQSWVFIGRTDAEAETPVLWPPDAKNWLIGKDPDAGLGLGAGGEGDDRGWDGWMASPTLRTWVWVNSGSWWWTGRLGMLWFMDTTERLNWTEAMFKLSKYFWKFTSSTHEILEFLLFHCISHTWLCETVVKSLLINSLEHLLCYRVSLGNTNPILIGNFKRENLTML